MGFGLAEVSGTGRFRFTFLLYSKGAPGQNRRRPLWRCLRLGTIDGSFLLMSKTAFLFPGQGSQFAGMGKSLAEAFPEAARVFEAADQALGFPLSRLCFEGPEEQLKLTENQQPALLTVSVAAYAVLRARELRAEIGRAHV